MTGQPDGLHRHRAGLARAPTSATRSSFPFTPWFQGAEWWLARAGLPEGVAWWLGAALVVLLVAGFAVFLFTPWVRRLGVDLRFWMLSYALYLLAVFFPQSSTFRLLVPLAPALGALAIPRSPVYRVASSCSGSPVRSAGCTSPGGSTGSTGRRRDARRPPNRLHRDAADFPLFI